MIALLVALALLAGLLEAWSLRRGFDGIAFDCRPAAAIAEPDTPFALRVEIENRQRMPVSFFRMEIQLPEEAVLLAGEGALRERAGGGQTYSASAFLPPRRRLTRTVTLSIAARGRYLFRGASLQCGDFLGLRAEQQSVHSYHELVVPPREAPGAQLEAVLGGFLGEMSVRRFLFEDPVLTVGARPYTGQEPMRAISWSHSARTGSLMVKQYDYTQEPTATVLLDVGFHNPDESKRDLPERCLSTARTLCRILEERGVPYDLCANTDAAGWGASWEVAEGQGEQHFARVLEGLGRSTLRQSLPLSRLLQRAEARQELGRCTLLLAPERDEERLEAVRRLEAHTGGAVLLITPEEVSA